MVLTKYIHYKNMSKKIQERMLFLDISIYICHSKIKNDEK
jgi:hypothetical protein